MLSRLSNVLWMEEGASEEQNAVAWSTAPAANSLGGTMADGREEMALPCFKSILDDGWYVEASSAGGSSSNQVFAGIHASDSADAALDFPPPADSSCFPSSVFAVDPSIQQAFFAPKPDFSSLISAVCSNPFNAGLGFTSDSPAFLSPPHSSVFLSRGAAVGDIGRVGDGVLGFPGVKICDQDLLPSPSFNPMSFDSSENSLFLNRAKVIKPLQKSPLTGVHPTLFQKRAAAALRQNSSTNGRDESMVLGISSSKAIGKVRNALEGCEPDRSGENDEEDIDEASFGGSGLNCDSEDFDITENMSLEDEKKLGFSSASVAGKGSNSYITPTGSGEPKGRKKGLPAKNLMAERRRRKKLNDRLYLLRSVVPRISKMDRASILGDAKEYLKELLQRINGLHDELESINSSLPSSSSTSFHPSTPTPPTLPCRLKDELRSSTLPSPIGQAATVEVRLSEGRAVNIHMFCPRRPGLLLSAMRALDSFGLDIQQAVISCFNGFALDVFRAELSENGAGVLAEEIKEVLLQSAGCQSTV